MRSTECSHVPSRGTAGWMHATAVLTPHLCLQAPFFSCPSSVCIASLASAVRSLSWLSIRRAKLVSVGVWACVLSGQAPVLYYSSTRWGINTHTPMPGTRECYVRSFSRRDTSNQSGLQCPCYRWLKVYAEISLNWWMPTQLGYCNSAIQYEGLKESKC